eukprot:396201-Rhodomonas_salina.4
MKVKATQTKHNAVRLASCPMLASAVPFQCTAQREVESQPVLGGAGWLCEALLRPPPSGPPSLYRRTHSPETARGSS